MTVQDRPMLYSLEHTNDEWSFVEYDDGSSYCLPTGIDYELIGFA